MVARTANLPLWHIACYTLVLTALGVAGNYFNLPLFFSVNLIFGSIAAFVALITLGLVPALIVSAAASSYTWLLWGHPYAMIIFMVEILFIGLLRNKIRVYAFSDVLFWLILGIPICAIFYSGVLGLGKETVFLIALKQTINGILNAIIAPLLVSLCSLILSRQRGTVLTRISAKQLVASCLMLMTILAGGIPIIFNNYRVQSLQEDNLIQLMTNYGNAVVEEIDVVQSLMEGEELDVIYKAEEFARKRLKVKDLGISITYDNPVRRVQIGWIKQYSGTGDLSHVNGPLHIWKPSGSMPELQRWVNSEYYILLPSNTDLNISEVIVTHAAGPIVTTLKELRTQTMIALALLISAALVLSYLLSEFLISPIQRLASAGAVLKSGNEKNGETEFPRSIIREYDELAEALQTSADDVNKNVRELTEMRDHLEQRVQERTAELRLLSTVASQSKNGVLIMDIKGVTEWVNDGLLRMTGYTREEFIGQYPAAILSGENTSARATERIVRAVRDRKPFLEEILYYTKSGDEVWVEVSCNPMTDENAVMSGYIAIITDVTARRMDHLNLVKARIEAERSNEAKSLFLSTMSHEIRTPLNGIMGMTQLLAGTKLDSEQKAHLKTVQGSCSTLLAIVNDVLDMSKIEAGALELEETPFNLQDLISSTLTPFQTLASEKGLSLNLGKLPDLKKEVIGDPVRIRQVLWNLVSNAIKFTKQGSVNISLALEGADENQTAILKVRDTGEGIAPDRLKDIFDPFTQEDNTITRKFGGTGLGLSIVKKLIELMHGDISVESTVGEGTCFTVTLPLRFSEMSCAAQDLSNLHKEHKKGMHVLVAEDNFVNITIAKSFLEKLGCQVSVVENGRLAVEEVLRNPPELVFMDIHMPEMDGVTATLEIRTHSHLDSLPIIGLTADAFKESKAKFEKAGMNDVLTKPFTEDQMQAVLAKFVPAETQNAPASPTETQKPVEELPAKQEAIPHADAPIGDDSQFEELKNILGETVIRPMLEVAPGSFRKNLTLIRQALADAHNEGITEASHAIKGSAGALYALRLAEQAAYIQDNSHDLASVKSILPAFEETLEDSIQWLEQK